MKDVHGNALGAFGKPKMLAQRPITLVLMMINSCSYSTNDLVFNKLQILTRILVGV